LARRTSALADDAKEVLDVLREALADMKERLADARSRQALAEESGDASACHAAALLETHARRVEELQLYIGEQQLAVAKMMRARDEAEAAPEAEAAEVSVSVARKAEKSRATCRPSSRKAEAPATVSRARSISSARVATRGMTRRMTRRSSQTAAALSPKGVSKPQKARASGRGMRRA
jgi:hypothetical protein